LAFWYGGTLVADQGYSLFTFFICFSALISGSQIAGSIFTFAPDASKAMHASWELKNILDRKPKINDSTSTTLKQHKDEKTTLGDNEPRVGVPESLDGSIEFRDVSFSYPSRRDQLALDGFNFEVQSGQNIALVGPSGCGKSTVFSLIERFYDPDSGSILAGGHSIAELDLARYRSSISLVSQDAIL
jgi:ATP-binding cassette subfamily B (MDR/TAP) protein 1